MIKKLIILRDYRKRINTELRSEACENRGVSRLTGFRLRSAKFLNLGWELLNWVLIYFFFKSQLTSKGSNKTEMNGDPICRLTATR